MPQPNVMTIQPLFCAFDCASSTAATTPSPSKIRSAVPMTSAGKMSTCLSSSPPRLTSSRRADTSAQRTTMSNAVRHCQTRLPNPDAARCPYEPGGSRRLCRTRRHSVKAWSLVVVVDPVERALRRPCATCGSPCRAPPASIAGSHSRGLVPVARAAPRRRARSPTARPAAYAAPSDDGLGDERPHHRHVEHVGEELHQQVVGGHAAVDLAASRGRRRRRCSSPRRPRASATRSPRARRAPGGPW